MILLDLELVGLQGAEQGFGDRWKEDWDRFAQSVETAQDMA